MVLFNPHVPSPLGPSAEDARTILVEQEEGQEMTTQPPFVGGPRPTMTKLQVNDYFSFLASHHASRLQTYLFYQAHTGREFKEPPLTVPSHPG